MAEDAVRIELVSGRIPVIREKYKEFPRFWVNPRRSFFRKNALYRYSGVPNSIRNREFCRAYQGFIIAP
jgi:hypothetical protein